MKIRAYGSKDIISTDEDPGLRIESFAVINLRGVSTNKTINCDITFLTMFNLSHPVNFPCGRKPERPEKTGTTFGRALTDSFHMFPLTRSENRTRELRGERRLL